MPTATTTSLCVADNGTFCTEWENTNITYTLDIGTTIMLGGLMMFFVAYWLVGLIRHTKKWS